VGVPVALGVSAASPRAPSWALLDSEISAGDGTRTPGAPCLLDQGGDVDDGKRCGSRLAGDASADGAGRSGRGGDADDERVALTAAAAEGSRADAAAATLELVGQVQDDAGTGHAERVAHGDGAAVGVDLVSETPSSRGDEADRGEGLVELEQVEVGGRDALLGARRP
jgi:hypothetical protein